MKRFVLLCIIALTVLSVFSDQYFKSNSIGMALEKIDKYSIFAYQYYIIISDGEQIADNQIIKKTLFDNGEVRTIWEKEIENGVVIKESIIQDNVKEVSDFSGGRLIEQSTYEKDELKEKWEYTYGDGGTLVSRIRTYPEDTVSETTYATLQNGRLRSQLKKTEDGSQLVIQGVTDKRYLQWVGSGDNGTFEHYSEGHLSVIRTITDGQQEEWFYTYHDDYYERTNIDPELINDTAGITTPKIEIIRETYNLYDKLLQKTVHFNSKRTFFENNTYENNGTTLIAKTVIESNIRHDQEYFYDGDRRTEELQYENKTLKKKIVFTDSGRTEYVFENDTLAYILSYDTDGFLRLSETADGGTLP